MTKEKLIEILKNPKVYGSLIGVAVLVGFSEAQFEAVSGAIAGIFEFISVFLQ